MDMKAGSAHTHSRISRRALIATAMCLPAFAFAHDGHGASDIIADAVDVSTKGQVVSLALQVTNLSDAIITIEQISVPNAVVFGGAGLDIAAHDANRFHLIIEFCDAVPGIFTGIMDFGDGSSGPLLIIP